MGKVLPFKTKREAEIEAANDMIAELRKMFTDQEVEDIRQDLEHGVTAEDIYVEGEPE